MATSPLRVYTQFIAILLVALAGCASPSQTKVQRNEKVIAKVLAVSAGGPVMFKDAAAASDLTSAVLKEANLDLVLIVDDEASILSLSSSDSISGRLQSSVDSVQQRIKRGETEFEFHENGLFISLVPIQQKGLVVGFVAVASQVTSGLPASEPTIAKR